MRTGFFLLLMLFSVALKGQTQVQLIDWENLKNPVYSHPGWSTKDACMARNDDWFYLFFSAFFYDSGEERSHVVSVKTKDFKTFSEPVFVWNGMEKGWKGLCSPDITKNGNTWILTFNSWGDIKDKPNQLFFSTSKDLVNWSEMQPLAMNITSGIRAIDAGIIHFNSKVYLVWKKQQEPLIAVADSLNDTGWKILGRPVNVWFENGQFICIDGQLFLMATSRNHRPSLAKMKGNGFSDDNWLRWTDFSEINVPVEDYNTNEAANAASLADWRAFDGYFYLIYAGRTEGESHKGRGNNKLAFMRSADMKKWELPGKVKK